MASGTYGGWPITGALPPVAGAAEHGYARWIAQKFIDTLYLKAMQTESDLERLVGREDIDGNPILIDALKPITTTAAQIAADTAGTFGTLTTEGLRKDRARFALLKEAGIPTEQRQMLPAFFDYMFYVDPRDKAALNRKFDPTGQFLTAVLASFNIRKDAVILGALDSNVTVMNNDDGQQTGSATTFANDGGTDVALAFGAKGYDISTGATYDMRTTGASESPTLASGDILSGLGLTVKKLIEARRALHASNAMYSGSKPICVMHPQQLHQLLANEDSVVNADYNAVKPLVTGEISQFLGMDIVVTNSIPTLANTNVDLIGGASVEVIADGQYAYVFMPDTLYYGSSGVETKVDILPEKGHTMQVASYMHSGAVRLDGAKVVRIACSDTDQVVASN